MTIEIPLPCCVDRLCDVLSFGRTFGHFWLTAHMGGGYIAGYMRVIEHHPWYRFTELDHEVFAEQHTGIDWVGCDRMLYPDWAEGWWLGFYCNHECDWPDETIAREYGCEIDHGYRQSYQLVRTLDYVEGVLVTFAQQANAEIAIQEMKRKRNG